MPSKPDKANADRKRRYYANIEHERERSRRRYQDGGEQAREASRLAQQVWRRNNSEAAREKDRKKRQTRHGGPDERARMWAAQNGLCYLCEQPLSGEIHVDHDHSCCDFKDTDSCRWCRRGLTHAACNQIWGLAHENPQLLAAIARNGERVGSQTRMRIAGRPVQEMMA